MLGNVCIAQHRNVLHSLDSLKNKAVKYTYTNNDSAYYYTNILKKRSKNNTTYLIDALFIENDIGLFNNDFVKLKINLAILDSMFQKNEIFKSKKYLSLQNDLAFYHGFFNYKLDNYKTSIQHFQNVINRTEKIEENELTDETKFDIVSSYSFIGKMYSDQGKYDLAKDIYNKAIRYIKTHLHTDKDTLYSVYNLLAEIYQKEQNYLQSNTQFIKTFDYHLSMNSKNSIMSSAYNIAENYAKLSKIDSAKFYLKIIKKHLTPSHTFNGNYFVTKANILIEEKKNDNAKEELYNALNFYKNQNSKSHFLIAKTYSKIANLNFKLSNYPEALNYTNRVINELSLSPTKSSLSKLLLFKTLKNKSTILNLRLHYKAALEVTKSASELLDSIKPTFRIHSDKLFLIENAFPLFENGIGAAYNLFQDTKDFKYIDQAFFYSEKSKSTLLLESLLSSQASTFANIPEDLIEKEKQLKAKITYLEKRINKKPSSELQDQLFDIKQDHRSLIRDMELNYKRYYDLKYNTQVLSLNELQKWLDNDTTLLSYFYGNNSIYTISVTKTTKHIERLQLDETFETLLKDSYALLSNPKSDLELLKKKTHELYQKLVQHSLTQSSKEKLIIIPDGLLNYLPFGSLSVNDNDYLIQSHAISYANSATLLMQLQTKKQHNNQVLAFAPNFDNSNTSTLLSLPNNTKEVKQVLIHFKGQAFINEKASLKNFNSKNKDFGIIHLATHAVLDDVNPEYSYLAFSPNSQDENSLYTNDLYNLELNSNMVTLSACESGIGDLKRGEGMMSLARGFYFSGTSSIASTLWKVNDASSSQLMDGFYENLSEGNAKDIALQKAKMNFINTNKDNALSHPYYWSGFIISGNTNALTSNFQWVYIALIILVLIVLGLIIYRKKRVT